jgi:amino-acid N-acetyltransferase
VKDRKMEKGVEIELVTEKDEEDIIELLTDANLPIEDLTTDKLKNFLVARGKDGSVIGTVGVESYQDVGLLRSLVVHPGYRGRGVGKELTKELESFARQMGIKVLFLLTMTAVDFFPKLGYRVTQRSDVPYQVTETYEFKSACPVSAVCLYKDLM